MLKKLTLLILLLAFTVSLKAQNSNLLVGTWIFKDVYNKEKIGEEGLKTLRTQVINKLTFTFKEDGAFFGHMMGENTSGTWTKKSNPDRVLLVTKDGNFEFKILDLTADKLAVKMGLGEFWMIRSRKK